MPPYEQKDIDRFWSYVIKGDEDDCWWWQGKIVVKDDARGVIKISKKNLLVNRVALADSLGRHIAKGLKALHECDNPLCVNPKHLHEGTQAKNMGEKALRGRCPKTFKRKLNLEKAREIRKKYKDGVKVTELAKKYDVKICTVYDVIRGRIWNTECVIVPENVITHE
jgi:hypothetical protein